MITDKWEGVTSVILLITRSSSILLNALIKRFVSLRFFVKKKFFSFFRFSCSFFFVKKWKVSVFWLKFKHKADSRLVFLSISQVNVMMYPVFGLTYNEDDFGSGSRWVKHFIFLYELRCLRQVWVTLYGKLVDGWEAFISPIGEIGTVRENCMEECK